MPFEITKAEVWEGTFADRPGALAEKMADVMRTGANLDLIIARPCPQAPGSATLFLAPLQGERQQAAAREAGFVQSTHYWLRLEGPDRPWLGAGIAQTLADAEVNIGSMTAATMVDRAVIYISFHDEGSARRAAQVLTPVLG